MINSTEITQVVPTTQARKTKVTSFSENRKGCGFQRDDKCRIRRTWQLSFHEVKEGSRNSLDFNL